MSKIPFDDMDEDTTIVDIAKKWVGEPAAEAASRGGLWLLREGKQKYLVLRRDGTIPEWPYFVLGAADPASADTLHWYGDYCEEKGYHPQYVADVHTFADTMREWREANKKGDPDAKRHRKDHPLFERFAKLGLAALDSDEPEDYDALDQMAFYAEQGEVNDDQSTLWFVDKEGTKEVTDGSTGKRYRVCLVPIEDQE